MVMALPKLEDASALEPTLRQTRVGRADLNIDLASGRWRFQVPKRTRVTSFVVPNMRQAHCFLQRDPIGVRSATNVYAYVENAPTMVVDPSGKFFGIIIGGIIGGIVGGVVGGVNGGLIGAVAGLVGGTVSGAIAGTGVGAGVAGAAGGAVGGAVAGALGGYGSGKGAGGIAASAGIGAIAGGLTGGVGGSAVGGIGGGTGSSAAVGAAGSITSAGITTYYDDLPSAMICAIQNLGRRNPRSRYR